MKASSVQLDRSEPSREKFQVLCNGARCLQRAAVLLWVPCEDKRKIRGSRQRGGPLPQIGWRHLVSPDFLVMQAMSWAVSIMLKGRSYTDSKADRRRSWLQQVRLRCCVCPTLGDMRQHSRLAWPPPLARTEDYAVDEDRLMMMMMMMLLSNASDKLSSLMKRMFASTGGSVRPVTQCNRV